MAYGYYGYQYPQYPQQQTSNNGLIWVQGEAGAKSYMVAPGSTVALWDSEAQTIYLKSADSSGMPSMRILDYQIRDNAPAMQNFGAKSDFVTKSELQTVVEQVNALKAQINDFRGGSHESVIRTDEPTAK